MIRRDRIAFGRGDRNDIHLDSVTASRRHAEVRREGTRWLLVDLGSRHGTRLNGQPISEPAELAAGDRVEVGDLVITFDPVEEDADGVPSTASLRDGAGGSGPPLLIGRSPEIRSVLERIDRIARSAATVLVTGETGTGKELVARLLHRRSSRAAGPFVVINCPALPGGLVEYELFGAASKVATGVDARPGKLELAHRGSLLLDEVGDLELSAQAKLLRFLQDGKVERIGSRREVAVDVRVIAATNRDLEAEVARGAFRLDLYHRLNTLPIHMPPLRDRRSDLPDLIAHFLTVGEAPRAVLSDEALAWLGRCSFPGNVRELERMLLRGRLLAEGPVIRLADLVAPDRPGEGAPPAVSSFGPGDELYARIVERGESFWDVVHAPLRAGTLTLDPARHLIARAYRETGRSFRRMARLFRIHEAQDYRRLVDFVRNRGLAPGGE